MSGINTIVNRNSHTTSLKESYMFASTLARTGGPSRFTPPSQNTQFGIERDVMPHMPLDTTIHWDWRNPLNVIPASVIGIIMIDIIALFL